MTGPLDGQRDLSGYFKMMWDDDNLYLLVEITDDEMDVSSPNGWENDCIQIHFDGDNSKNVHSERPSDFPGGYDENDYQITAVFGQNPTQAGNVPGQVDLSALDFEYQQQHKGYTIEAALPFDALLAPLQVTVTIGYCFGFELVVNDRDSGEWQNGLKWTSGQDPCGYLNPSEWGTAVLLSKH